MVSEERTRAALDVGTGRGERSRVSCSGRLWRCPCEWLDPAEILAPPGSQSPPVPELVGAAKVSDQFLGSARDLLGEAGLDIKSVKGDLPLSPGERPPPQNVLGKLERSVATAVLHPAGTPEGSAPVPAHGTAPEVMVTNL